MRRKFSPAMVIATIALFVALGGSAVAAKHYIITKSSQVKNGSLQAVDLSSRARRSLRGAQGPAGPGGPAGPAGPAGVASVTQVSGNSAYMPPNGVASSQAFCPAGTVVVGGGWDGEDNPPVSATTGYDDPIGQSWEVIMAEDSGVVDANFHAVAICAGGGGVVAARSRTWEKRQAAHKLAAFKAKAAQR